MTSTFTLTYTRTHTATFVADNIGNLLRNIINYYGLDPENLLDDWKTISNGMKIWLESEDLKNITIEFYKSGQTVAEARWDFPISYDGSGVGDDMWVDNFHLQRTLGKAPKPSADCHYRITLRVSPGAIDVDGFSDCQLLSTEKLRARSTGTVIATGDIMASGTYWR
jgi:hypothetical protein